MGINLVASTTIESWNTDGSIVADATGQIASSVRGLKSTAKFNCRYAAKTCVAVIRSMAMISNKVTGKTTPWLVVLLTVVTTSIGMMGFAAVFPLLNLWVRDLGISCAEGGLLSGFWYLPDMLVALSSGWLFERVFGDDRVLRSWSHLHSAVHPPKFGRPIANGRYCNFVGGIKITKVNE
ncbi:MAG: hypothetical protein ACRD63_04595 [Pyrinomonadaceae bacterium]